MRMRHLHAETYLRQKLFATSHAYRRDAQCAFSPLRYISLRLNTDQKIREQKVNFSF